VTEQTGDVNSSRAQVATPAHDTDAAGTGAANAPGNTEADILEPVEIHETVTLTAEPSKLANSTASNTTTRRIKWSRKVAFGVLPAIALVLTCTAGYLKWQDNSAGADQIARTQSIQAARDSTIALLSYKPDTVEQQLTAARDRLGGEFLGSYTSLTNDVVIPGAKQQQISAVATVPAAAAVSADPNHAVVLIFVNQTVTIGNDAPTDTASSVRVSLERVNDRWLITKFDPV
jgi:Mce-associated membrane protein